MDALSSALDYLSIGAAVPVGASSLPLHGASPQPQPAGPPPPPTGRDAVLPDAVLFTILSYLPADFVAQCSRVCTRWRTVCFEEPLWRKLCRAAIALHHPDPRHATTREGGESAAEAGGEDDAAAGSPALSLSVARQQQLDLARAIAEQRSQHLDRAATLRAEVVDAFRTAVNECKSFRLAYRTIPQVRSGGVYALRHSYVRKGVRDLFHSYDGILNCVYYRLVWLRPADRSLVYLMTAGELPEALRVLKRFVLGGPGGVGSLLHTDGRGGGRGPPAALPAASARPTPMDGPGSSTLGRGHYRLEGAGLHMTIFSTTSRVVTRWECILDGAPHLSPPSEAAATWFSSSSSSLGGPARPPPPIAWDGWMDRITVLDMALLERGADEGAATPLREMEGQEFAFHSVPWLA